MTQAAKKILFIAARAPNHDDRAQELLDMLLVCATFGAEVSVLFEGDGIWQLLPDKADQLLERRSIAAQLGSLPLFDVEHVYVDAEQLTNLSLQQHELCLPCQALAHDDIVALVNRHQHIVRF